MRVNASQVHEARMIATHVYKFIKRYDKKPRLRVVKNSPSELLCFRCINDTFRKGPINVAVTTRKGDAICLDHARRSA